jgi:TolB-like protein
MLFMRSLTVVLAVMLVGVATVTADEYDAMAKIVTKGAKEMHIKKVAVLPFPYHDGATSSGSTIISERLTTRIVKKNGVQVIERSLLDKVYGEMKLEKTGAVDPDTIKQLGKILGVDAVVTGTLIDLTEGKTEVNARLITVETGEVIVACEEKVEKNWPDSPQKNPVVSHAQATVPPPPARPQTVAVNQEEPADVFGVPQENRLAIAKQRVERAATRRDKAIALFILGRVYEQRQYTMMARQTYRKIIKDFPLQQDIVNHAYKRLAYLR